MSAELKLNSKQINKIKIHVKKQVAVDGANEGQT